MEFPRLSTLKTGLACRCPRCGKGPLFKGYLSLRAACPECGLDYGFADPADGPAFFVMSGVAIVVTAFWGVWAVMAQPPIWAQFAVVFPALIGGCLGALRPVKAWMVAEQYVHKAEEARWSSLGSHGKAPESYKPRGW